MRPGTDVRTGNELWELSKLGEMKKTMNKWLEEVDKGESACR